MLVVDAALVAEFVLDRLGEQAGSLLGDQELVAPCLPWSEVEGCIEPPQFRQAGSAMAFDLRSLTVTAQKIASGAPGKRPVSWASDEGTRRSMQANRRTDTTPELLLRSALHVRGLRFRKDYRIDLPTLRVRVDIAFPREHLAIFVDGCFWHRCPVHATDPRRNAAFWKQKLQRNVERDRTIDAALTLAGWRVIRSWEHELPDDVAERIAAVVRRARGEGIEACR